MARHLEQHETETVEARTSDPAMQQRVQHLRELAAQYRGVFEATDFSHNRHLRMTEEWLKKTKLTDDRSDMDSIVHREEFFQHEDIKTLMKEGVPLHMTFKQALSQAKPYISSKSYERWISRFYDESVGFQAKRYWVTHQLSGYIDRWKKVAEEYDALSTTTKLRALSSYDPRFAVLLKRESFLELHYEERKGLLAEARSALARESQEGQEFYETAKQKLLGAVHDGYLAQGKVGLWLERLFGKNASRTKIQQFVLGSGPSSLDALMQNWKNIKHRYDKVVTELSERGEADQPRGLYLVGERSFLGMHYVQRLHYVEEMERRLGSGTDLDKEPASFIRIRHAIDTRDWGEAALLIASARKEDLSSDGRARLDSMHRYVTQFAKNREETTSLDAVMAAKSRLDELVHQVPSSLQPMVFRLLRGPNANRSIHQLRWIVYNNKWCRDRGYLSAQRAAAGASAEHEKATKERAEQGLDTGLHDSIGHETSEQAYFRKKEFANHKATYLHVNTKSAAPGALAEWLEHEQDPKVLYWTTFCAHEDGLPMSDNWHNDLLHMLGEMRSLTKTIGSAGFIYRSPHEKLGTR